MLPPLPRQGNTSRNQEARGRLNLRAITHAQTARQHCTSSQNVVLFYFFSYDTASPRRVRVWCPIVVIHPAIKKNWNMTRGLSRPNWRRVRCRRRHSDSLGEGSIPRSDHSEMVKARYSLVPKVPAPPPVP